MVEWTVSETDPHIRTAIIHIDDKWSLWLELLERGRDDGSVLSSPGYKNDWSVIALPGYKDDGGRPPVGGSSGFSKSKGLKRLRQKRWSKSSRHLRKTLSIRTIRWFGQ